MEETEKQIFAQYPKEGQPWDVLIIGSGPAAFTAAIYTTRGAASTLILAGEIWGGQLMLTTDVDNYPGFPDGVLGPDLMTRMRKQAERFGAKIVEKKVTSVNFEGEIKEVEAGGEVYRAKAVIIATGADTRWLNVPGEDRLRGRGVSSCAPCDAPFFKDKEVLVVGGGDSAMEEALVLTKYATTVTIIHRRNEFKASQAMQKRVFEMESQGKIKVIWDTEVIEMLGEDKLSGVRLKTKSGSQQAIDLKEGKIEGKNVHEEGDVIWELSADGAFVAIGHSPSTEIFKNKIELDEKGYVVVHDHTKTSQEKGVFVAGDVHDYSYRQAITAAGFGCMAAMDTLKYLDMPTPNW